MSHAIQYRRSLLRTSQRLQTALRPGSMINWEELRVTIGEITCLGDGLPARILDPIQRELDSGCTFAMNGLDAIDEAIRNSFYDLGYDGEYYYDDED